VVSRYKVRQDKSVRPFGGYNWLTFGDASQIPPIPPSTALFLPPVTEKSALAKNALDLFWTADRDALNYFQELTEQKRIEDAWYASVMDECRCGTFFCSSPTGVKHT